MIYSNTTSRVNLQFNPQQIATKGFSTDLGSIWYHK